MKKATPKSIAVWGVAATLMIGTELSTLKWPAIAQAQRLLTGVAIVLLVASMKLMADVPSRALFPSTSNSAQRNILNVANFAMALVGALAFLHLAGLFGHPLVGSATFWVAAGALAAAVLFQAAFVMVTNKD